MILLVLARLVAGELPVIARAVVSARWEGASGLVSGLLGALGQVLPDAMGILVASSVLALLGGERARAARGRELDLGAHAWIPYLTAQLLGALLFTALRRPPTPFERTVVGAVGLAWAGAVWLLALVVLRRGEYAAAERRRAPAAPSSAAGHALLGTLGLLFVLNVVAIARRPDALKPVGADGPAPDFSLPLLGGGEFRLHPPGAVPPAATLVDFWATWCGPCREELPVVERLWKRYQARGLRVVAVDVEPAELAPEVERLVRRLRLTFPVALAGDRIADRYRVGSLPHVILLDRRGQVRRVFLGVHGESEMAAAIERLLAEQPTP